MGSYISYYELQEIFQSSLQKVSQNIKLVTRKPKISKYVEEILNKNLSAVTEVVFVTEMPFKEIPRVFLEKIIYS